MYNRYVWAHKDIIIEMIRIAQATMVDVNHHPDSPAKRLAYARQKTFEITKDKQVPQAGQPSGPSGLKSPRVKMVMLTTLGTLVVAACGGLYYVWSGKKAQTREHEEDEEETVTEKEKNEHA